MTKHCMPGGKNILRYVPWLVQQGSVPLGYLGMGEKIIKSVLYKINPCPSEISKLDKNKSCA